ncbi:MAG: 50S ribosomal protein L15 [Candidatus Pacebacteria bacterium]|nr:50S ribosomal protein L15 [Candidatus Paceibacterota bacterium]
MQINDLQPQHKNKDSKRIGRGGSKGTYCGKGIKGQKSRAGRKMQPFMREIIKRYPKIRGYRQELRTEGGLSVNLNTIEKIFGKGEKITPNVLVDKKIVRKIAGKTPIVKILGNGEITKAFIFEGCLVSKVAKEKVEKAGGKIS